MGDFVLDCRRGLVAQSGDIQLHFETSIVNVSGSNFGGLLFHFYQSKLQFSQYQTNILPNNIALLTVSKATDSSLQPSHRENFIIYNTFNQCSTLHMDLTTQEKAEIQAQQAKAQQLKKQEQGNKQKLAKEEQKNNQQAQESGEDSEGDDAKNEEGAPDGEKKKKKKKKKNKKKTKAKAPEQSLIPQIEQFTAEELTAETQTNERFRCLGGWPNPVKIKLPTNQMVGFPANQLQEYKVPRVKNEETKAKEALLDEHLQFLRKGAQIQRQVRRFAQRIIKPGRRLADICQELQNYNRKLAPENGLKSGIGFPTGCSLNHVAAHYTPNPGDNTVLGYDDVCKIDFGTHINGRIIDTAFTVAFNPTYDKLLEAVKDATNTGLREAGIDVRISDIGAAIQETMESYEVEIKGKVYPVKVVKNLNGHSIDPYKIHAGKTVPCVKNNSNVKMEEGEQYAIQTFGSTGKGFVKEDGDCSHYMKDFHLPANVKIPPRSKAFYNYISERFDTLAFCKRWLQKSDFPAYILPLKDLVSQGIINPYPPLCDVAGSYVAQWEHTFILRPTCKQILSRGDDY